MKMLQRLLTDLVMIEPGAFAALQVSRGLFQEGLQTLADSSRTAAMRADTAPKMTIDGDVAIVPITGILAKNPDAWELYNGVEDSDAILELLDQADANPAVKGVLLNIDSPGGLSTSLDLGDKVTSMRARKPIVAYTSNMMTSLAYYVGSQAHVIVSSRNALVGSIGVYSYHVDLSRLYADSGISIEVFRNKEASFKAAGLMGMELTDEQKAHITERSQQLFEQFKSAVRSTRRGVSDGVMRGQTLQGSDGKTAGLVDAIGTKTFATAILKSEVRKLNQSS